MSAESSSSSPPRSNRKLSAHSPNLNDIPADIDRLAQEIRSLGRRHRSLSVGEDGTRENAATRPRSASRGSLGRDPDKATLGMPRNSSFSGEGDLDSYYEGVAFPGFIDGRPLTRRYLSLLPFQIPFKDDHGVGKSHDVPFLMGDGGESWHWPVHEVAVCVYKSLSGMFWCPAKSSRGVVWL